MVRREVHFAPSCRWQLIVPIAIASFISGVSAFPAPSASLLPYATSSATDVKEVLRLCYASSLSYLPIDSIAFSEYAAKVPSLNPVAQVVEPKTESGATIFVDKNNDDAIIIACRGSATPKNFVTNLRFRLSPLESQRFASGVPDDVRAHEGFQEAADGLWELLEPKLFGDGFAGSVKKITFTGHSLGGGTAEMCALHAATSSISGSKAVISDITTFGGPQIGNVAFARYVDDVALPDTKIRHIVHGADPILENNRPLWKKLGFKRSGEEIRCDPFAERIFEEEELGTEISVRMVPWNILDHCKYLGVYIGPRLK